MFSLFFFSFVVVSISISALNYTSPSYSASASPSLGIYKYFYSFWPFFCVLLASCMQIFVFKWKNGDRVLLEWNRKGDATKVRTAAAAAAIEDLSWREEVEKEVLTCHESAKISNKNIKLLCI